MEIFVIAVGQIFGVQLGYTSSKSLLKQCVLEFWIPGCVMHTYLDYKPGHSISVTESYYW